MGATILSKIPTKHRRDVERRLKAISKLIVERRKYLGLTQEELSEQLGIATTSLQSIEQCRRFPSVPMLALICEILDLELMK